MQYQKPQVFAVKHIDEEVRAASRSGGIFTALSDEVLANGGIVYGCVLNEEFEAIHVRAESDEERNRMRGSKYIQSNIGDVFKLVAKDLKDGKKVLFSGTSCQVAGLKGFLKEDYSNLFCVDIVCHGVPSPLVWREYLKWQERKNGKIVSVDFRNKKDFGWSAHIESLINSTGKQINSRVFTELFYGHTILRPSCFRCPYKSIVHPGNITIADYWGIEKAVPGFNDNKGVSLVLINDDKGLEIFNHVKKILEWQETRIEDSMQPPLVEPFSEPQMREMFWKDFYKVNFDKIAKKYGGLGVKAKVRRLLGGVKRKVMKVLKEIFLCKQLSN